MKELFLHQSASICSKLRQQQTSWSQWAAQLEAMNHSHCLDQQVCRKKGGDSHSTIKTTIVISLFMNNAMFETGRVTVALEENQVIKNKML